MDWTVSYKPGCRFGPQAIRHASYGLEEFSPWQERELSDCQYADGGNIWLPVGNVEESLEAIYQRVAMITKQRNIPFLLGGEHLISLPAVRAVAEQYPELVVLHLDAHADLRDRLFGQQLSHGTVLRRICEHLGPDRVYQFGIRSGDREEFAYGRAHTNFFPFTVSEPLQQVLPALQGRPVYLTLDIDVVDPAFAPGTGTPEPGGCTSVEILKAMALLPEHGVHLVGLDLVEVAPACDPAGITAMLAAKLIREAILAFAPSRL